MKFLSVLALCAVSPVALGGVYLAGGTSAGNYAGKSYGEVPDSAPAQAPAPAPYTAPAPAPYTAPAPAPYTEPAATPNTAPAAAPYTAPVDDGYKAPQKTDYEAPVQEMCWTETKKCCWKEKADGYECKDDYATKQARCHPKIKYERKCDKAKNDRKAGKPKEYVNYGETETVEYDAGYGPHVEGYPNGGTSDTYDSKELPEKPYGVEAEPYQYAAMTQTPASYGAPTGAPASYEAPAQGIDTSDNGYSADGNGYDAASAPASNGY